MRDITTVGQLKEALAGRADEMPLVSEAGLVGIALAETFVDECGLVGGKREAIRIRPSARIGVIEKALEQQREREAIAFLDKDQKLNATEFQKTRSLLLDWEKIEAQIAALQSDC